MNLHEKIRWLSYSQLKTEKNQGLLPHHYYAKRIGESKKANNKEIEQTAVLLGTAKKKLLILKSFLWDLKDEISIQY